MSTNVVLTPNAPAMLNSMRALGYSFNTAVADVIDNSISAGASMVDVSLEQDESGDCFLAILDDGSGMDKDHLREAMRYACRSSDEDRACAMVSPGTIAICPKEPLPSGFGLSLGALYGRFVTDGISRKRQRPSVRRCTSRQV